MVRGIALISALLVTLLAGNIPGAGRSRAQALRPEYVPGEVIIKFTESARPEDTEIILQDLGAARARTFSSLKASHQLISGLTVEEAIARYEHDQNVEFIEPNYIVRASELPNDPMFGQLWGLENTGQSGATPGADIRALSAWDVFTGSSAVVVGVIDTGVDYTHPDLAANIWTNPGEIPGNGIDDDGNGFIDDMHGWDFVNNDSDPMDDYGHGTHVAGTIGAVGNNGIGVAGVNWNASIMGLKFLDASGSGTDADAISCIEYATMMHARILNASWGGGGESLALRQAIEAANEADILFVAAAGNGLTGMDNDRFPHYPSSYDVPNIVAVAATDWHDGLAPFSFYGALSVDLGAPGVAILSCVPGGGYASNSGTSMATPHVSGVLALMLGLHPTMTGANARTLLLSNTDPLPSLAGRVVTGGRLNAFRALGMPDSIPPAPVSDLTLVTANGDWVELEWTATGDDSLAGRASRYDVRYSTTMITEESFSSAAQAMGEPDPAPSGSRELMRVTGLDFSTDYHFALKVLDEYSVASPLSNVVTGRTLVPPVIEVSPNSFTADLYTGGMSTQTLTIRNTGGSELSFDLDRVMATAPQPTASDDRRLTGSTGSAIGATDAGAWPSLTAGPGWGPVKPGDLDQHPEYRMDTAPVGYQPAPSVVSRRAGAKVLLLQDAAPWGSTANEQVLTGNGIVFDLLSSSMLAATDLSVYDLVIVPSDQPTSYYSTLAVRSAQLDDWVSSGGVLEFHAAGWGWSDGNPSLVTLPGGMQIHSYNALRNDVLDPSHPLVAGVPASFYGNAASRAYLSGIPAGAAQVVADDLGRTNLVVYPFGRGTVVAGCQTYEWGYVRLLSEGIILANMIPYSYGMRPKWLSMDPVRGVVPPGGSVDVAVRLDATENDGGEYRVRVLVRNNDPLMSKVWIPATLRVTGAPDIAVQAGLISLESVQSYQAAGAVTTHHLALPLAPIDDGNLELIADGHYVTTWEKARVAAEGLTLGEVGATGATCSSARGTFRIGASDLATLAADGVVDATVHNPGDVDASCPTNQHRVRLSYRVAGDSLRFGTPYVGQTRQLSLQVENHGNDVLEVSSVTAAPVEFIPGATRLSVAPHASEVLTVTFQPGSPGLATGTLVLVSNDPDEGETRIGLRGECLVSPTIEVGPDSLAAHLYTGQESTQTLTIRNTGGSDLTFELDLTRGMEAALLRVDAGDTVNVGAPGAGPGQAKGGDSGQDTEYRPDEEPAGYQPIQSTASRQAGAKALLVQDEAPWGKAANELVLASNGIAYDLIRSSMLEATDLSAYDLVIVPSAQRTSYYAALASLSGKLDAWVASGGVLEFHTASGWSGGNVSLVTLPGGMHVQGYNAMMNDVVDPAHPLAAGIPDPFYGGRGSTYASHAHFRDVPGDAAQVMADDLGEATLVVYPFGGGAVMAGCQPYELAFGQGGPAGLILGNMIPYVYGMRPNWLAASALRGSVPAGGSLEIAVRLDATRIDGGDYRARLLVRSNDPLTPGVSIPLHLRVTGIPDIAVQHELVRLESTQSYQVPGALTTHHLTVTEPPLGAGSLELVTDGDYVDYWETAQATVERVDLGGVGGTGSACTSARGAFGIEASWLAGLAVDGVVDVSVQNPWNVDASCPTNQHRVRLEYELPADSLRYTLYAGQSRERSLMVENRGGGLLDVSSITVDRPEFALGATQLSIAPHATGLLKVTFQPGGPGVVTGTLVLASNDPDRGEVRIGLRGECLDSPVIGVSPDSIVAALSAGRASMQVMTVRNTGGSDLTFEVKSELGTKAARLPANPGDAANARAPGTAVGSSGGTTGARALLVQDVAPWGTTANEQVLTSNGIAYDLLPSSMLAAMDLSVYGLVIVPSNQPTAYYTALAAESAKLDEWVAAGGVLEFHAAGWGASGGDASLVTLPGGTHINFLHVTMNYVLDLGHPLVADVQCPLFGGESFAFFSDIPGSADLVMAADIGRPNLVVYPFGSGTVVAGCQVYESGYLPGEPAGLILARMIPYAYEMRSRWLAVDPLRGVVPAGGSVDIAVLLDATGIDGGDYRAHLRVQCDDPMTPEVSVPVHLQVTGIPDIAVHGELVSLESTRSYLTSGAETLHRLVVTVPPADGGELELFADGNYDTSDQSARLTAEGLSLGDVGGTGMYCGGASGAFPIGAADLDALVADGIVDVSVQNSPTVTAWCSSNRHRVRLNYRSSADTVDFGSLFVGRTRAVSLQIENRGSGVLSVSSISVDRSEYTPGATQLSIAPHEADTLSVAFLPTGSGIIEATLLLVSNDPDEGESRVRLRGEGLIPPLIGVSPDTVMADLPTGQAATQTLTVRNTGGSDLTFELAPARGMTAATMADPSPVAGFGRRESKSGDPEQHAEYRVDQAPTGYQWVQSTASRQAGARVLLVQDAAPWGSTMNEQVLATNGIAYDLLPSSMLAATDLSVYDLVIVPSDQPTSYYSTLAGQSAKLDAWVTAGGILEFHAAGWGWSDGDASLVTLPGGTRIHYHLAPMNEVLDPTHSLVAGVQDPFSGRSRAYFSRVPWNAAQVTADDLGRTNLVVYPFGTGTVVAGCQPYEWDYTPTPGEPARLILANMIPYAHNLRSRWLAADPVRGSVPAGGSVQIAVRCDAANLGGGDYRARLLVRSNDPVMPEVTVPVHLRVTGIPAVIGVSPDSVVADLYAGQVSMQTLTVRNAGTRDRTFALEVVSERAGAKALLLQDVAPWGRSANEQVLTSNGISYDLLPSSMLAATDLSAYGLVIVPSEQPDAYYSTLVTQFALLDRWVAAGGVLECHAVQIASGSGLMRVTLPGGMRIGLSPEYTNLVLDPRHPLVAGVPDPFGSYPDRVSYCFLRNIPSNATRVTTDNDGQPNLVVYPFGAGNVVTGCQLYESSSSGPAGLILGNMIPYAHSLLPNWLSVDPPRGVVPAGGSADIAVRLDATGMDEGDYRMRVVVHSDDPSAPEVSVFVRLRVLEVPAAPRFIRGDDDGNGVIDIADPIFSLAYQFAGGPATCPDALDTDDSGEVNISDPIYSLACQFSGGPAPPAPFPGCGEDPTEDSLDCASPPFCTGAGLAAKVQPDSSAAPVTLSLGEVFSIAAGRVGYPVYVKTDLPLWGLEYTLRGVPASLVYDGVEDSGFEFSSGRTDPVTGRTRVGNVVHLSLSDPLAPGAYRLGHVVFRPAGRPPPRTLEFEEGTYVAAGGESGPIVPGSVPSGVFGEPVPVPDYVVCRAMPNPFSQSTVVRYSVPTAGPVSVEIYDATGRRVRRLDASSQLRGWHEAVWNGRTDAGNAAAKGIYFVRVCVSKLAETERLILLRTD